MILHLENQKERNFLKRGFFYLKKIKNGDNRHNNKLLLREYINKHLCKKYIHNHKQYINNQQKYIQHILNKNILNHK